MKFFEILVNYPTLRMNVTSLHISILDRVETQQTFLSKLFSIREHLKEKKMPACKTRQDVTSILEVGQSLPLYIRLYDYHDVQKATNSQL